MARTAETPALLAAIANHGAVALRNAITRAMGGDRRPLARLGIASAELTLVDLWRMSNSCHDRMTAAECTADVRLTNIALATAIGADKDLI
mgnify:CR=1 FL=1